jgi:hypothetical protein
MLLTRIGPTRGLHYVAFADEALHGLQLGTLYILAGSFVSKCFIRGPSSNWTENRGKAR